MIRQIANVNESRLRILSEARLRRLPRAISKTDRAFLCYIELVEEGLLDGCITISADGCATNLSGVRITPQGEEYLEKYEPIEVPRPLTVSKQAYVFMECLAAYLVVLTIFTLTKIAERTEEPNSSDLRRIEQRLEFPTNEKFVVANDLNFESTFGVCGAPPAE